MPSKNEQIIRKDGLAKRRYRIGGGAGGQQRVMVASQAWTTGGSRLVSK
jgi:hypothetical protein